LSLHQNPIERGDGNGVFRFVVTEVGEKRLRGRRSRSGTVSRSIVAASIRQADLPLANHEVLVNMPTSEGELSQI